LVSCFQCPRIVGQKFSYLFLGPPPVRDTCNRLAVQSRPWGEPLALAPPERLPPGCSWLRAGCTRYACAAASDLENNHSLKEPRGLAMSRRLCRALTLPGRSPLVGRGTQDWSGQNIPADLARSSRRIGDRSGLHNRPWSLVVQRQHGSYRPIDSLLPQG